ncbi:MAG: BRCA1-associated RING domain protein 1 [Peltula sp. TS41687]|nr:MAG: BRCA1-associated RING domain protein 1 [Peltula sp. TS41687]
METITSYPSFPNNVQSLSHCNGDPPSPPPTNEEWAKIADAVERRRLQNRNAQRKYRTNLKRRAEILERHNGGKASRTSSPHARSRSRSTGPRSQPAAGLGITQDVHPTARSTQTTSSPAQTPPPNDVEVPCVRCLHHQCESSQSSIVSTGPVGAWLSSDNLIDGWTMMGELDPQDPAAFTLEGASDKTMPATADAMTFPDLFENPSVVASLSPSSDGMPRPGSEPSPGLTSYFPENNFPQTRTEYRLGYTMLHIAAAKGNLPMMKLLLEKGSDPNAQDSHGWTALHLAVEQGHQEVANLLLESGANLYAITQR